MELNFHISDIFDLAFFLLSVYSNDVTLVGNDCCQCAMVLFTLFAFMASIFGGVELGQLHSKNSRFSILEYLIFGSYTESEDFRSQDQGSWDVEPFDLGSYDLKS